jgi:hypothetical protein
MKKWSPILSLLVVFALLGCKGAAGSFQGHTLGETFGQFSAIEHPQAMTPPGISFTGVVHCFDDAKLGDKCGGQRQGFDNAHFTFVDDKLVGIESVGAGGIIGDQHQNWNWNLYLSEMTKQYGKPDKITTSDALWLRRNYVVHGYLVVGPLPFSRTGEEGQDEHFEVISRNAYDQAKN